MEDQEPKDLIDRAALLLGELTEMQNATADQDVPGWVIGKPSLAELNSDLTFMSARSKPDEHSPFYMPAEAEAMIAVVEGSIRINAGSQSVVLIGRHCTVITAGPNRSVTALEPLTRVYLIYFRSRVENDGKLAITTHENN